MMTDQPNKPMTLTEIYLEFGIDEALKVAEALGISKEIALEIIDIGTGGTGDVVELTGEPPAEDE
jgi:hypothetical protein